MSLLKVNQVESLDIVTTDIVVKGKDVKFEGANVFLNGSPIAMAAPANYKLVKTLGDLPVPVGSVITLQDNYTYQISGTINLGTNRIQLGVSNTIFGQDKSDDKLIYTGTGNMFTSGGNDFSFRNFLIYCPSGTVFNCVGLSTTLTQIQNCIFYQSQNIGTFDTGKLVAISENYFSNSKELTILGTVEHVIIYDNNIDDVTSGTVLSIPSGTYVSILISRNHVHITSSGVMFNISNALTITSGALTHNTLVGNGTYLTGLLKSNVSWLILANKGIASSNSSAFMIMDSNAVSTAIGVIGTFVKLLGTTILQSGERFTMPVSNRLTYIGELPITAKVIITGNVLCATTTQSAAFRISKNGASPIIPETETRITAANQAFPFSFCLSIDMVQNDYIELWITNQTALNALTVRDLQILIED
ncbi:MAG: hypothetical protein L6Q54_11620 [Leptospiraceae bacterium]|nr:hypothetical protein [Leptospiraceae bacterium]